MTESNKPCRVILARHGQTEWNKEFRFQGKTNVQLTEEGKRQAHALSERLSSWPPDIIYSSPLDRALYTAQAIAERHNMKPVQSINGLEREQHEIFSRWRADPFFNPPEGAETWNELSERLTRAVQKMLAGGHKRIVAVSHGGIMRALYAVFTGLNPHKTWNMDVSNCSISGIEMRFGRPCLAFANDDLHIRAGAYGQKLPVWGTSYELRA